MMLPAWRTVQRQQQKRLGAVGEQLGIWIDQVPRKVKPEIDGVFDIGWCCWSWCWRSCGHVVHPAIVPDVVRARGVAGGGPAEDVAADERAGQLRPAARTQQDVARRW
jgi:hypothetical protein